MVHEVSGQHLGRLLIRLLAGEVDLVVINSMTAAPIDLGWRVLTYALSAALSRSGPELVESSSRFRRSAFTGILTAPITVVGAGKFRSCNRNETRESIGAWRARAISSWTATST